MKRVKYDSLTLRPMTAADITECAANHKAGWPKSSRHDLPVYEDKFRKIANRMAEDDVIAVMSGTTAVTPETGFNHVLIAEYGGAVVGHIVWSLRDMTAEVESLLVKVSERNKGYYTRMFEAGTAYVFEVLGVDAVQFDANVTPLKNTVKAKGYDLVHESKKGKQRVRSTRAHFEAELKPKRPKVADLL